MQMISTTQRVFVLVLVFLSVAIVWLIFAELDQVVRLEGVVEPKEKVQTIASRYPGTVRSIDVVVGNRVKQGQILLSLDDTDAIAAMSQAQFSLEGLIGDANRLAAVVSGSNSIVWSDSVSEQVRIEQSQLFRTNKMSMEARFRVLEEEVQSLENQLAEIELSYQGNLRMLELKQKEREIIQPLVADGIEPAIRLLTLDQEVSSLETNIRQAKVQRQGVAIALQKIEQTRHEIQAERVAEAAKQLVAAQTQIRQREAELVKLANQVDASALYAPIDGYVTKVEVSGRGEVVGPGDPLLEVVPDSGLLQVKCRLRPQDLSNIEVGQPAKLSLSAYDFTKHGYLKGNVSEIAKNTTESETGPFYETWIQITDRELSKSGITPDLLPGMLVTADVQGEKRTVLEYVLQPIQTTTSRALTEM